MHYLLHLLFSFFLGPMFMFAASGGMGDLGGGGGDAGTDAGAAAGDAGAGGGEEVADDLSAADGAGGDDGERSADEGLDALADDPDAPVDLGDGRTVPAKWKSLFDAAKEKGLDKEVKQLFFGNAKLTQKFPGGVNEAVKLADTIQEFGGLEGINEIKSDNESFQQDAEKYMTNPQEWLGETFENNPDAALKAFALSLDLVSEKHPEQYDHLMAKVIRNDMDENSPVHSIYELLAGMKDNPQAQAEAKKLAAYYNQRSAAAKKVPEKKVDAERQKLEADRAKLGTEKEQLQNHTVNSQTIPLLGRNMTTQIDKLAKEAGFDLKKFMTEQPEAFQAMRGKIFNSVMEKAAADKTFKRNYQSVMKEGNTTRAVKMMNDKHDAILGDIVRQVAKGFGIAKKAGAKPGQQTTRQVASGDKSGTMTRVSAKPPSNEIDWDKTGSMIYDAKAVLRNGKTVTWA